MEAASTAAPAAVPQHMPCPRAREQALAQPGPPCPRRAEALGPRGDIRADEVVRECPWEAETMSVSRAAAQPARWGRTRTRKFLGPLALNENRPLGTPDVASARGARRSARREGRAPQARDGANSLDGRRSTAAVAGDEGPGPPLLLGAYRPAAPEPECDRPSARLNSRRATSRRPPRRPRPRWRRAPARAASRGPVEEAASTASAGTPASSTVCEG